MARKRSACWVGTLSQVFAGAGVKVVGMTKPLPITSAVNTLSCRAFACDLGQVLVAATPRGIAAVLLGDDVAALEQDLARRFSDCSVNCAPSATQQRWMECVVQVLQQPQLAETILAEMPLHLLTGTALQRKVWAALQTIAVGQTRSYTELAQAMGQPQAVRAIASACGANPCAVIVPCHRVLRSDGGWGGYRWGLQRKRWLLQQEGVMAQMELDVAAK